MRTVDWVAVAVLGAGLVGGGVYLATRPRAKTYTTTQERPPAQSQGAYTLPAGGSVSGGAGTPGSGPGLGDVVKLANDAIGLFNTVSGWF